MNFAQNLLLFFLLPPPLVQAPPPQVLGHHFKNHVLREANFKCIFKIHFAKILEILETSEARIGEILLIFARK